MGVKAMAKTPVEQRVRLVTQIGQSATGDTATVH
jgi:hypothetical protein